MDNNYYLEEFEDNRFFWVGEDIDDLNSHENLRKLLSLEHPELENYSSVEDFFQMISESNETLNFKLLYVVVNESLMEEFFELYKEKAIELNIICANIIISKNIYKHINNKYINNYFYNPGGITDDIRSVVKYFKNIENYSYNDVLHKKKINKNKKININEKFKKQDGELINLNEQFKGQYENMFYYIDNIKDLILPTILDKLMNDSLIDGKELYEFQILLLNNYPEYCNYICPSKEKNIKIPYEFLS